ncbi:MAG TPA: peptidoglycan synthetase [Bacteroidetes bacterium]|nr:peptidoglycan synthetase [Bacteroidota bacterium]
MRIHFIAIGGAVMHNLALALHEQGNLVTGSDDEIFDPALSRLRKAGIVPDKFGWFPDKLTREVDAVILGMHAHADNPELMKAKELGLKIYSFPEFIYEHSKAKKRVVIGGSHGKTTITSMILHVLKKLGKDFDYMVGSKLEGFELMVRLSDSAPYIILEGDEYPDSAINKIPKFHLYKADIGFISGIAWDHINVFPTFENYCEQFRIFCDLIPDNGKIIFNEEDKDTVAQIHSSVSSAQKIPYHTPNYEIVNGITYLKIGEKKIPLRIFGKHNLSNMMGALEVCKQLGVDENEFADSIASFNGAANRLEKIAANDSVTIFKDFAHSPSKLRATISAVREQFSSRKIIACMELHTYSSLNKNFISEYAGCMQGADVKVVFFNPHTIELKRLENISNEEVKKLFAHDDLLIMNKQEELKSFLHAQSFNNSVLLLMTSGNFDKLDIPELIQFVLNKSE